MGHEVRVQRLKSHTTGGADGFVDGPCGHDRDGQCLDGVCQSHRVVHAVLAQVFIQDARLDAIEPQTALEVAGQ